MSLTSYFYHRVTLGFKLLFQDAKDVSRIKVKMGSQNLQVQDLPYREMEKLRQVSQVSHHRCAHTQHEVFDSHISLFCKLFAFLYICETPADDNIKDKLFGK